MDGRLYSVDAPGYPHHNWGEWIFTVDVLGQAGRTVSYRRQTSDQNKVDVVRAQCHQKGPEVRHRVFLCLAPAFRTSVA
ncbi:MAG: hypothetical protein ACE5JX_02015, partial [Acidobacteriota bacterium]